MTRELPDTSSMPDEIPTDCIDAMEEERLRELQKASDKEKESGKKDILYDSDGFEIFILSDDDEFFDEQ